MIKKRFSIIFGLTADPIHKGHEQVIINGVDYCRDNGIEIERFLLIPVYQPNLISDKKSPVASFEQRFFMCELVANRLSKQLNCDIQISGIEKELAETTGNKNYSFNTVKQLNIENTLFLVSADHFQGRWPKFRKWFKWQEILEYSGLLINQRPGHKINEGFIHQLKAINPNIFLIHNSKTIDVSSSVIRKYFNLSPIKELLSDDVVQYIKTAGLYR